VVVFCAGKTMRNKAPKRKTEGANWSTRPLDDELGEALRVELLGWPGVTARPMMGTLGLQCRQPENPKWRFR